MKIGKFSINCPRSRKFVREMISKVEVKTKMCRVVVLFFTSRCDFHPDQGHILKWAFSLFAWSKMCQQPFNFGKYEYILTSARYTRKGSRSSDRQESKVPSSKENELPDKTIFLNSPYSVFPWKWENMSINRRKINSILFFIKWDRDGQHYF